MLCLSDVFAIVGYSLQICNHLVNLIAETRKRRHMPKFNANLTMLFTEVDFLERFELAAKNGFDAIEYLFPYEWSAAELADSLAKHDLKQVLHNLPAGDWGGGERGIACLPGREGEFQDGVGKGIGQDYGN